MEEQEAEGREGKTIEEDARGVNGVGKKDGGCGRMSSNALRCYQNRAALYVEEAVESVGLILVRLFGVLIRFLAYGFFALHSDTYTTAYMYTLNKPKR